MVIFLEYFAIMTATAKKETTVWAGMWTRGGFANFVV